jgi:hypothetical protein
MRPGLPGLASLAYPEVGPAPLANRLRCDTTGDAQGMEVPWGGEVCVTPQDLFPMVANCPTSLADCNEGGTCTYPEVTLFPWRFTPLADVLKRMPTLHRSVKGPCVIKTMSVQLSLLGCGWLGWPVRIPIRQVRLSGAQQRRNGYRGQHHSHQVRLGCPLPLSVRCARSMAGTLLSCTRGAHLCVSCTREAHDWCSTFASPLLLRR